jgi:hypothetical protein
VQWYHMHRSWHHRFHRGMDTCCARILAVNGYLLCKNTCCEWILAVLLPHLLEVGARVSCTCIPHPFAALAILGGQQRQVRLQVLPLSQPGRRALHRGRVFPNQASSAHLVQEPHPLHSPSRTWEGCTDRYTLPRPTRKYTKARALLGASFGGYDPSEKGEGLNGESMGPQVARRRERQCARRYRKHSIGSSILGTDGAWRCTANSAPSARGRGWSLGTRTRYSTPAPSRMHRRGCVR